MALDPGASILASPASLKPAPALVAMVPAGPPMDPDEKIARQFYSLSTVVYFWGVVLLCCCSLAAAARLLAFFFPEQARQGLIPHSTTGRMWLLRLGYYKLHAPLAQADDWVWLADHAIQIGTHRFLGIVAIRLADLPPPGECLKLSDLTPVALIPTESSTQALVHQQLEEAAAATGVTPRAILSDEGCDLAGGIDRFCQAHPQITRCRDLPHAAARLLKHRLEKSDRWAAFVKQAGQTKFQTSQTELAFLTPPSLRSKARYMNLDSLLQWAEKALTVLDDPSLAAPSLCSVERLNDKFGWLREYRQDLQVWSSWLTLIHAALDVVRRHGYCPSTAAEVRRTLAELSHGPETQSLRQELVEIVDTESAKAGAGERLPGSTEILESSFGKLKEIEGDQSRSGFTSLVLMWAALFGVTTPALIKQALVEVPVKAVLAWVRGTMGSTLQSKRAQLAHALRKKSTEKPEEG